MAGYGEWNESLFGCFDDTEICLLGWCCSSCLFGQNAHKTDGTNFFLMCFAYGSLSNFCCLHGIIHYKQRQTLRQIYGLREDPCNDCPITFFCSQCANCQEARFLKYRVSQPGAVIGSVAPGLMPQTRQPRTHY